MPASGKHDTDSRKAHDADLAFKEDESRGSGGFGSGDDPLCSFQGRWRSSNCKVEARKCKGDDGRRQPCVT
ncbi:hypothetical protein C1H46_003077 [Malus baccata]|uniref:Uncharacterized protein n=1 Tax=Malus baccata TaxID=106549 RepID=A0A540NL24_MALBA|nr:hypothetical protein C1H46_003077 [Malus baccata]